MGKGEEIYKIAEAEANDQIEITEGCEMIKRMMRNIYIQGYLKGYKKRLEEKNK